MSAGLAGRIFPAHAYSDAPTRGCFWAETVPDSELERPPLEGRARADVAIIGAGFTGLNAALALARAGVSVTVLDARFPGWGASGRNGGFCCLGGAKASDSMLDRAHGKPARLAYRRAEMDAVAHVSDLLEIHDIDALTHSEGETVLAHKRGIRFAEAAREVEENYGVTPTIHSTADLPGFGMAGAFHGGMTTPVGFGLHPRAYLAGLLGAAEAAGVQVFGDSPVTGQDRTARHCLTTPRGKLEADNLLIATNGYSSDALPPWLAARYMPAQSSVIVTRPLSEAELANGWNSAQMAFDSRTLLHYFRLMPDRRFLFGMRGGLGASPRSEARVSRKIRADFERMFPFWRHVETPHYWSGMVCLSGGLTPFCGPVPGEKSTYAALAYHGNGVAMGSYAGALIADRILGQRALEVPQVMQTPPRRFPLGRFRRALMLPLYAGAWLRDL
ncbi:FAD-binding oxidoreductase [Rhodobacteraceae bacterium 63075]|nr:FAD-binding oxidoreductase [Rhodobacteraceae bacterium 63075]